jgi:hypothetical protein
MTGQPLVKRPPEQLKLKEWVTAVHVGFQQQIVTILLGTYGFLVVCTMALFFLQGFHAWGFTLDPVLLKGLSVSTVGEIGVLLISLLRASFK